MTSPRLLWPIFILLAVVTLLATGWVSVRVIRLEQQRIEESRRAKVEENVSLALWRIDSLVAPLIAVENARPFQEYNLDVVNWYDRTEEDPKLENRYFTLQLLPNDNKPAEKVQVVNGVAPKSLQNPQEVVRLLTDLPEPTIRPSESPMVPSPSNPMFDQEKANILLPVAEAKSSFKSKKEAGQSKNDYQARQSTFNRMMNYSTNAINPKQMQQAYGSSSSQPMPMYNNGMYNQPAGMPQQDFGSPQTPGTTYPPANASAPSTPTQAPPPPQLSQPAPNQGTFYLPLMRTTLMPAVMGQVEYSPPDSSGLQTVSPTVQQTVPPVWQPVVLLSDQQTVQQTEQQEQTAAPVPPPIAQTPTQYPSRNPYAAPENQQDQATNFAVPPVFDPDGNKLPYGNASPSSAPVQSQGQTYVPRPGPQYGGMPQQRAMPQAAMIQQAGQAIPIRMPEEGVWAPMRPVCIDDQLLLLRRVRLGERSLLQGCVFDWPRLARFLEKEVADLLPDARLVLDDKKNSPGRMLASLPVRLEPGSIPVRKMTQWSTTLTPVLASVAVAFGCVLLSIGAFAVLLVGMLRLGRRRSEFVTAVTHELRTPLTTFRMYSEMLAEGMVEEGSQKSYLQTLESEADRLTHLVENVLSSARLERGRHAGRLESLPIGELITPIASRLAKRCERAAMRLEVEISETVNGTTIQTNPTAVEQILWNLVDNACKYATSAADRTIRMACEIEGDKYVAITVSDRGPGIPREVRRRLFCGFSKTASEAARSAPGVGLGLALSRRLARDLGGNLELLPSERGASFVLRLELR